VFEGDTEGRRLGGLAVGHRERIEDAVDGDGVHRHLRPLHELLDERDPGARSLVGARHGLHQLVPVGHEGQSPLALPVRCFHDSRNADPVDRIAAPDRPPRRLRHPRLVESLPLPELRHGERRRGRRERVR